MHPIPRRRRVRILNLRVPWRDANELCSFGARCEVDLEEEFRWKFPLCVGKL